jgi:predicted negative regulator of RcsB-dependent stress response
VDEYLSEREQLERLTGWLRVNIPWILIGLAVGGAIVGGWRWWQARSENSGVAAAQAYSQILDAFDRGDRTRGQRVHLWM